MKTKLITLLMATASLSYAADVVVLPDGMQALTPDGVTVTTYNKDNKTTNTKPMVKTDDGRLFFTASTAEAGDELWVSDGTPEGTMMVKDIYEGTDGANPQYLTAVGDVVYFTATTSGEGNELWVSDGTEEGTYVVKDIYPGATSSTPFALTEFYGKLLFFALDEESEWMPIVSESGTERWLWITDGTEEGTERIGDVPTREGSYDGDQGMLVCVNGKAVFPGYSYEYNETLWVTDGTREGTMPLLNINPRVASSASTFDTESANIDWVGSVGNGKQVMFRAETVSEITGTSDVGSEIWVSDGTTEGTQWIGIDFGEGETDGEPADAQFALTKTFGDTLLFRANSGVYGVELCMYVYGQPFEKDVNPRLICDVNHWSGTTTLPSWPSGLNIFDGHIYFQANGGYYLEGDETQYASGYSLWRVDRDNTDLEGGQYVKQFAGIEIYKGDAASWFTNVYDKMFFSAQDDANNNELWVMTGADAVPTKVVDFPDNGIPYALTEMWGDLYFVSTSTAALYKYDVATALGIEQSTATSTNIKVSPVPATDVLNISEEVATAQIYDITGSLVLTANMCQQLNVSNLSTGMYILSVQAKDGSIARQTIVIE